MRSVLVDGLPHHQAVFSVEILGQLLDASVSEVIPRLEGAVGERGVLPLSQDQHASSARGHHLNANPSEGYLRVGKVMSSSFIFGFFWERVAAAPV